MTYEVAYLPSMIKSADRPFDCAALECGPSARIQSPTTTSPFAHSLSSISHPKSLRLLDVVAKHRQYTLYALYSIYSCWIRHSTFPRRNCSLGISRPNYCNQSYSLISIAFAFFIGFP